ncbi:hypothetical protein [Opitutus sp. ER46]|uniref:hypothetical protein n=1 Tax=Opitutus sp. ER46 TaxID=2161864 RepID=UPI000D300F70|nr:hypothetical protein [Opitutus sp. ER46]PTX90794.1 hypothetical protein DB354_19265 [Opitutus sp. ER46]
MNSLLRDLHRSSAPRLTSGLPARALPAFGRSTPSRSSLPVVSNRAFIGAWMMRRDRLAAAAQLTRGN